jgi:hypothetical protein
MGAAAAGAAQTRKPLPLAEKLDKSVDQLLKNQIVDPSSRHRGGLADISGLVMPATAGGMFEQFTCSYVWKDSKHHSDPVLIERMQLAAGLLTRSFSRDGNIDLLSTNFNSAPDTGFLMHNLCTAGFLARKYKALAIEAMLKPILLRAGEGLAKGGVHTPNHRWVICSALAQLNELYPDSRYTNRIEQWLAEGIDIDSGGQFSERSTTIYSAVCDRAFTVMAAKLNRPQLLEPVRSNLQSLLYLLHPNGEVVTEISRRQDRNQRATADRYWFPIRYLAVHDKNGQFETLAREYAPNGASASALLEYPELSQAVDPQPLPDNFERTFPSLGIARLKRGSTSATLILGDSDRFFSFRRGPVGVNAIRFASAFFGKGQFEPQRAEKQGAAWYFEQNLTGPYYQPLDPPPSKPIVTHDEYTASRRNRRQSEVCRLKQQAWVKELANGFSIRLASSGTDNVPLAVEISFLPEGTLEGCTPYDGAWILESGAFATAGSHIKFGPGLAEHRYIQVRGALPRLDGRSVYLTASTPFDHTIRFEWI